MGRLRRKSSKNKDKGHAVYVVNSIKDIYNIIIPHYDKYPLLTIKRVNYLLFKEIIFFFLMNDKKHLTEEGLIRIMSIRVKMNKKTLITSYDGPLIDRDVPIVPSLNKSDITSD